MLTRKRKNKRNWEAENLMGLSARGFSLWLLPPLPPPPAPGSSPIVFLFDRLFDPGSVLLSPCIAFSQALSVNQLAWRPRDLKRFGRQNYEV